MEGEVKKNEKESGEEYLNRMIEEATPGWPPSENNHMWKKA